MEEKKEEQKKNLEPKTSIQEVLNDLRNLVRNKGRSNLIFKRELEEIINKYGEK